jgi:hypothetical protein
MPGINCNHVFVNVTFVGMVQVSVMKVVSMSFVLNSGVSATRTMLMRMLFVNATQLRHKLSLCAAVEWDRLPLVRMRDQSDSLHSRHRPSCLVSRKMSFGPPSQLNASVTPFHSPVLQDLV